MSQIFTPEMRTPPIQDTSPGPHASQASTIEGFHYIQSRMTVHMLYFTLMSSEHNSMVAALSLSVVRIWYFLSDCILTRDCCTSKKQNSHRIGVERVYM